MSNDEVQQDLLAETKTPDSGTRTRNQEGERFTEPIGYPKTRISNVYSDIQHENRTSWFHSEKR